MDRLNKKLPIGIQNFEELRNGGYHYVDKSDMVWEIANSYKFCFLSRPRRFGKSLLASTLHCYFAGRSDLFQGLKIMELEKEWPKRQVFHFDFSGISTAEKLRNIIEDSIKDYEVELHITEPKSDLSSRMIVLMKEAYSKTGQQVAVLVDEYDAPLQNTLFIKDEQEALKNIYRDFFPCFKTGSHLLKCLFLTGIMKFTQLSLFSVLNTVVNISFKKEYATVCGITKDELVQEFDAELEAVAEEKEITKPEAIAQMEAMYDGYHFNWRGEGVFNPYSVINALSDRDMMNYWVSTGGNQMLSSMLERFGSKEIDYEGCVIERLFLEESDANATDVTLFLYQAGYLTIKDYSDGFYTLGFPNREVRQALYRIVLPNALSKNSQEVRNCTNRIKLALHQLDVPAAMENLQAIIAGTPYSQDNGWKALEERFVFIVKHIFYLCDCELEEERHVARGRIDLVAHHPKCILVMEMKMDSNGGEEAAKEQMAARRYADAYKAERKPVFAISMEFSTERRGMTSYKISQAK